MSKKEKLVQLNVGVPESLRLTLDKAKAKYEKEHDDIKISFHAFVRYLLDLGLKSHNEEK